MIKYGVVGMPAFQQDLQHWSHLYVAGRLHKPVAVLTSQPDAEAAYKRNLQAALTTALLLMPQPESSFKVRTREQQWSQHHASHAVALAVG
jgi:translocator assembly and maintenance protein 41